MIALRRVLFVAAFACALFAATRARADLDPSRADDDVKAAMDDGTNAFCTAPPNPMRDVAYRACEMAKEIPNCAALVARCSDATNDEEAPKSGSGWLQALGPLANALTWILAIVLVVVLLVPIARLIAAKIRDRKLGDAPRVEEEATKETAPPPVVVTDAERLLSRAEQLARAGETTAALTTYLEASLRALDHRGAIHFAPHRTNGEYVRACGEQRNRQPLREIVRDVDSVQFGGARATQDLLSRVATRAASIVGVAMLALFVLVLVGCGGGIPGMKKGSDPLGDDLFRELLRRQNVQIHRAGPLGSLSLENAESQPALVLDAETIQLDDDADDRLSKWIDAGGTLVLFGAKGRQRTAFDLHVEEASTQDIEVALPPETTFEQPGVSDSLAYVLADLSPVDAKGKVIRSMSIAKHDGVALARLGGQPYAIAFSVARGRVLFVANDDLLTNIVLARKGNAAVLTALLRVFSHDGLAIVRPEDATSFADSPLTSLVRAGLGPAVAQTVFAALLLFLAFGVRATRPKPTPPPTRRAFAEHVRATGALWSRAKIAPHALASYARWLEDQVRARAPAGTDPSAWLAARSGLDPASCAELWDRATRARSTDAGEGDELLVLRRLGVLYSSAIGSERSLRTRG